MEIIVKLLRYVIYLHSWFVLFGDYAFMVLLGR